LRGALEGYASSQGIANVHFVGFKNQKELPRYFGAADVFVLPSGIEPWGLVINEAMNFGLPVICSDQVGCAADLVRPGENGYIFPVGNIQSLADRLLAVLSDGEKCESMGRRSRELVAEWGFGADAEGLVAALTFVSKKAVVPAGR
jgi:glycosyltransferase involved in cell wall biosynthesis